MFVIFTDEVGDDETELDRTVGICRRYEIPVYCIGVPAPFGRRETLVKVRRPRPQVRPRRRNGCRCGKVPNRFSRAGQDRLCRRRRADGLWLGPYSLTRLCYETGGIFFSVASQS